MFGITIWEIMYGKEPYEMVDAMNIAKEVCINNKRPEFLWDLPAGLKTWIKKCWDGNPSKRPLFKNIAKKLIKLQASMKSNSNENYAVNPVDQHWI